MKAFAFAFLALLASIAPVLAQGTMPRQTVVPLGYCQITSLSSATKLTAGCTVPAGATMAFIRTEGAAVRLMMVMCQRPSLYRHAQRVAVHPRVVERDHQRCILPMTVKVLKFRDAENRSFFGQRRCSPGSARPECSVCKTSARRSEGMDQADDRGDRPGAASGGSVGAGRAVVRTVELIMSLYIVVGNDLLVIADATAQIADPGYQAYLCNRCHVGARLWKHVADLSDLTFLRGGVEILTKHLACGIF
jgi:hypothetical protein